MACAPVNDTRVAYPMDASTDAETTIVLANDRIDEATMLLPAKQVPYGIPMAKGDAVLEATET